MISYNELMIEPSLSRRAHEKIRNRRGPNIQCWTKAVTYYRLKMFLLSELSDTNNWLQKPVVTGMDDKKCHNETENFS